MKTALSINFQETKNTISKQKPGLYLKKKCTLILEYRKFRIFITLTILSIYHLRFNLPFTVKLCGKKKYYINVQKHRKYYNNIILTDNGDPFLEKKVG